MIAHGSAPWQTIGAALDRWEDGEHGMRGAQRDALLDTIIDYFDPRPAHTHPNVDCAYPLGPCSDPQSQAHAAPTSRAYSGADAWVA